jgi:hypothetical protein
VLFSDYLKNVSWNILLNILHFLRYDTELLLQTWRNEKCMEIKVHKTKIISLKKCIHYDYCLCDILIMRVNIVTDLILY